MVFSLHRHRNPKRIVCTIGSETSTSHDMATQAPALHIGDAEPVQCDDAEHVVPTAATASMVVPVKVTVKDITAGTAAGAVDTHVLQTSRSRLDLPKSCSFPCHVQTGTTQRWCNPLPNWVKNRSRHHQCQAEAHPWTTLPRYHGPP